MSKRIFAIASVAVICLLLLIAYRNPMAALQTVPWLISWDSKIGWAKCRPALTGWDRWPQLGKQRCRAMSAMPEYRATDISRSGRGGRDDEKCAWML